MEYMNQYIEEMKRTADIMEYFSHYVKNGYSTKGLNLTEEEKKNLLEVDHGCTASAEDGCIYCSMLLDLGLIQDYDPDYQY